MLVCLLLLLGVWFSVIGLTVWRVGRLVWLFGLDGLGLLFVDCLIVAGSLDLWFGFGFWFAQFAWAVACVGLCIWLWVGVCS